MKRSAPNSAVLRHPPSSWAAVVHWSALIPKAQMSSRRHPIHSFASFLLALSLLWRKKTVDRDQLSPGNLPVYALGSRAQGCSTPLAQRRSSCPPPSSNLVHFHPIKRATARLLVLRRPTRLSTARLPSSCVARPPERIPNWSSEEAHLEDTILNQPNHRRESTDRLNCVGGQLMWSLEGESDPTPYNPRSNLKTLFRRKRARDKRTDVGRDGQLPLARSNYMVPTETGKLYFQLLSWREGVGINYASTIIPVDAQSAICDDLYIHTPVLSTCPLHTNSCCCFSHSAHWLPTRKNYFTRWSIPLVVCWTGGEKNVRQPPPPRCLFGENKK